VGATRSAATGPFEPSPGTGEGWGGGEPGCPEGELVAVSSSTAMRSPTFTLPADDDGISIDALSDSTVISDCSVLTVSPGLTSSSMTATSLKSPMSGTRISMGPTPPSPRPSPAGAGEWADAAGAFEPSPFGGEGWGGGGP